MENNKYLNRIVGLLVRGTNMDFDNEIIEFPSSPLRLNVPFSDFYYFPKRFLTPFSKYCRKEFGLSDNEIDYVWKQYVNQILTKK